MPNPKRATTKIPMFLRQIHGTAPSEFPHKPTSSNNGGKTNARAVEHKAPISDINIPRFGTTSAIATGNKYN